MKNRLPVLLIPAEHRDSWQSLFWEAGLEPVLADGLDPAEDPGGARRWLETLSLRRSEPATDSLTGLLIRREALRDLEEEASVVEAEPLWLALFNIDNFKSINGNFGHGVGDQVLTEVSRLLQTHLVGARVLGRVGGDTLLAALRGDREAVRGLLVGLLSAVRAIEFPDRFLLTLSAGLARHRPGEDVDDLIDRADRNLYAAKNQGRNRIVDEGDFEASASETDLDAELADFENRVRVFADRLVAGLTGRGRRMVETYRDEADHDGLTGLFNRRYFDRRLVREIQRSRKLGSPLTLILLDLDDFGSVNRNWGYPAGDEALRAAAEVVLKGIRVVDWAARYGGEELCAVFPDTEVSITLAIGERMRKALEALELKTLDGAVFQITASFGIVSLTDQDTSVPLWIQRAGAAVRASKLAGKNRVTVEPT